MMNLNAFLKNIWLVPDSWDYPDTVEYHFSATNDLSLPISDNELDTLIDDLSLALNQINLDGADLDVVLPGWCKRHSDCIKNVSWIVLQQFIDCNKEMLKVH